MCPAGASGTVLDLSGASLTVLPRALARAPVEVLRVERNALQALPPELARAPRLRDVLLKGNPLGALPRAHQGSWSRARAHLAAVCDRAAAWRCVRALVAGAAASGKSALVRCLRARDGRLDSATLARYDPTPAPALTPDALTAGAATGALSAAAAAVTSGASATSGAAAAGAPVCNVCEIPGCPALLPAVPYFARSAPLFLICHNAAAPDTLAVDNWLLLIRALRHQWGDQTCSSRHEKDEGVEGDSEDDDWDDDEDEDFEDEEEEETNKETEQQGTKLKRTKRKKETHQDKVSVFVVATHMDLVPNPERTLAGLRARFGEEATVLGVSCKTGAGVAELRARLADALTGTLQRAVPPRWVLLHDLVAQLHGVRALDWRTFTGMCQTCGISAREAPRALDFLAASGTVIDLAPLHWRDPTRDAHTGSDKKHQEGHEQKQHHEQDNEEEEEYSDNEGDEEDDEGGKTKKRREEKFIPEVPLPQMEAEGSGHGRVVVTSPQWLATLLADTLLFREHRDSDVSMAPLPVNGVVPLERLREVVTDPADSPRDGSQQQQQQLQQQQPQQHQVFGLLSGTFGSEDATTTSTTASQQQVEADDSIGVLKLAGLVYGTRVGAREYDLVPALLPAERPLYELARVFPPHNPEHLTEHRRVFRFSFLPAGAFQRVIVALLNVAGVRPALVWKNGAVLSCAREVALVECDPLGGALFCTVRVLPPTAATITALGDDCGDDNNAPDDGDNDGDATTAANTSGPTVRPYALLRAVVATVGALVDQFYPGLWNGLRQYVPCPHCCARGAVYEAPGFLALEQCTAAGARGAVLLRCPQERGSHAHEHVQVRLDDLAPDVAVALPAVARGAVADAAIADIGVFGRIFAGTFHNHPVAVAEAQLRPGAPPGCLRDLCADAAVLRALEHPNLVHFYGLQGPLSALRLVTERLAGAVQLHTHLLRTARDFLRAVHGSDADARAHAIAANTRLVLDIARGVHCLHSLVPPLAHGALSSYTVLVVPDGDEGGTQPQPRWRCKLADVALGRYLDSGTPPWMRGSKSQEMDEYEYEDESAQSQDGLTPTPQQEFRRQRESYSAWRWCAPEVLRGCSESWQGDLYAVGVLLWEVLAVPALPFQEYGSSSSRGYAEPAALAQETVAAICDEQLRPTLPAHTPPRLAELVTDCWQETPDARPSANTIVERLKSFLGDGANEVEGVKESNGSGSMNEGEKEEHGDDDEGSEEDDEEDEEECEEDENGTTTTTTTTTKTRTRKEPQELFQYATLWEVPPNARRVLAVDEDEVWVATDEPSIAVYGADGQRRREITAPALDGAVTAMARVDDAVWVATAAEHVAVFARGSSRPDTVAVVPAAVTCFLVRRTAGGRARVWAGTRTGTILVLSAETLLVDAAFAASESARRRPVARLCAHGAHTVLAAVGRAVHTFDARTCEPRSVWPEHVGAVTGLVSCGARVWTATSAGEVRAWRLARGSAGESGGTARGTRWHALACATGAVAQLLAAPAQHAVWCASHNTLVAWDARRLVPARQLLCPPPPSSSGAAAGTTSSQGQTDPTAVALAFLGAGTPGSPESVCGSPTMGAAAGGEGPLRTLAAAARAPAHHRVLDVALLGAHGNALLCLCADGLLYVWRSTPGPAPARPPAVLRTPAHSTGLWAGTTANVAGSWGSVLGQRTPPAPQRPRGHSAAAAERTSTPTTTGSEKRPAVACVAASPGTALSRHVLDISLDDDETTPF